MFAAAEESNSNGMKSFIYKNPETIIQSVSRQELY